MLFVLFSAVEMNADDHVKNKTTLNSFNLMIKL